MVKEMSLRVYNLDFGDKELYGKVLQEFTMKMDLSGIDEYMYFQDFINDCVFEYCYINGLIEPVNFDFDLTESDN